MTAKAAAFGSHVTDLRCKAPHMPVVSETVLSGPFITGPGGKGSDQAVAASIVGSEVAFVTKIGKDLYNPFVLDAFARFGLTSDYLYETE